MPDPKHPDDADAPTLLSLCQQLAKLQRYHENCVTFYASGQATDEGKKQRHEEYLKTVVAVRDRICKKQKVKAVEAPLLAQVIFFASEIGLPDAEARKFFFNYESKGWSIGLRSKVKNWEARLRLWHENWKAKAGGSTSKDFGEGF